MAARGPQNGRRGLRLERCELLGFGRSNQLLLNKFFDPSTFSKRKSTDGGKKTGKGREKRKEKKTDENSGHYVVASSRPPKRHPLERRSLVPIRK